MPDVVLGISCDYHDAAAALLVDGAIVAAVEEERCSRRKHDARLPEGAVRACLDVAGLSAADIDHVVFYEKPLVLLARYLAAHQRQGPSGLRRFVRDVPTLVGTNLMIGRRVERLLMELGASRPPRLQYEQHHVSHAAAAFYPSPFEAAAVVTIDGLGEWATATIGRGDGDQLELLEELRYPDSIGLLYSFVTAYCGFTPNDGEYQLMGLAPYGVPRFLDVLRDHVELLDDGSVQVHAERLSWFGTGTGDIVDEELGRRFDGPPRRAHSPLTQREADLAASMQALCEDAVLAMARRAHELTGATRLCLGGGVALNCVANGRVLREGPFEELWVQPAAGDAGSALGAALAHQHLRLGRPRTVSPGGMSAALGPALRGDDVRARLDDLGVAYRHVADDEAVRGEVAARLADGEVVGWFRGRMEFGPRALGHRSLLADPRQMSSRTRLNRAVKGREDFRPFAPAVLEERAHEWFELDHPSPHMLIVAPVVAERAVAVAEEPRTLVERAAVERSTIPACTHVDGSARVQTVPAEGDPASTDFRRLLEQFDEITGCPVLVNTSFNRAGEPIVATVDQAVRSAADGGIDLLVLEDALIDRPRRPDAVAASPEVASSAPRNDARGAVVAAWAVATVPMLVQWRSEEVGAGALALLGLGGLLAVLAPRRRTWPRAAAVAAASAALIQVVGDGRTPSIALLVALGGWLSATAWGTARLPHRRALAGGSERVLLLPALAAGALVVGYSSVRTPLALVAGGLLLVALSTVPAVGPPLRRLADPAGRAIRAADASLAAAFAALGSTLRVALVTVASIPIVLVPWLVGRVTRWDQLWAPRSPSSRWVRRTSSVDRPAEPWFTDPGPPGPRRRRMTIRFAAFAALALLAFWSIRADGDDGSDPGTAATPPGPQLPANEALDALEAAPWFDEYSDAYRDMEGRSTFGQYQGTVLADVRSRHLNVVDGVRRTWDPGPACPVTLRVWWFGGSAAFGTGQRDEHNLPSTLARIAAVHGVRLEIENRAVPGDTAWQATRRMLDRLDDAGPRPDLVLFYDGFNDLLAQDSAQRVGLGGPGTTLGLLDATVMPWVTRLQWQGRPDGGISYSVSPPATTTTVPAVADSAGAALDQYTAADREQRLVLAAAGVDMVRYVQPDPATQGDRAVERSRYYPRWPEIARAFRAGLPDDMVDLGPVLDHLRTPVYVDVVHTLEIANDPIAEAIWDDLVVRRPQLAAGGAAC